MSGNSAIKAGDIQHKNYPDPSDGLMAWSPTSNAVVLLPVGNLFAGGNTTLALHSSTPANSTVNTTSGAIWFDNTYLYVSISNTVTKQIPLNSF